MLSLQEAIGLFETAHYRLFGLLWYQQLPKSQTISDNSVLAALDRSGLPAFLPHPIRLLTQVVSARAGGLERALFGPAIAPPP